MEKVTITNCKYIYFHNSQVVVQYSTTYQDTLDKESFTPDLILKIGLDKNEFYCHRLMFAASSDFLKSAIATANPGTIPLILLPDLYVNVIDYVLKYIYYGEVKLPATEYPDLVDACKLLQLKSPVHEVQMDNIQAGRDTSIIEENICIEVSDLEVSEEELDVEMGQKSDQVIVQKRNGTSTRGTRKRKGDKNQSNAKHREGIREKHVEPKVNSWIPLKNL